MADKPPCAHALYLHGFPGLRSREMLRELGARVTSETGVAGTPLAYPGLHDDHGPFSFRRSIAHVREQAEKLAAEKRLSDLFLIGHSWGAFVSLALCHRARLAPRVHLILLAPLTGMPDGAQPKLLLDSIRELYPEKFSPARIEVLTAEVTEVVTDLDLWGADLATRLAYTSLSLILATQDTAIPRDRSARFLARLEPESFSLHELEDDHSFTQNRTQLAAAVVSAVFATLPPGG